MPTVEKRHLGMALHGTGTVTADSTASQFMKVVGDDEFEPQTDPEGAIAGVLYEDKVAGQLGSIIVPPGEVVFEEVGGGVAAGDEIEIGTDAFPTKLVAAEPRGLVIAATAGAIVVSLYAAKGGAR